jgi:hypothetical protein
MTRLIQRRIPKKVAGSRVQFTMQSVRMSKSDNRQMKAIAKSLGMSFNLWAVDVLTKALQREQRKKEREKNGNPAANGQK